MKSTWLHLISSFTSVVSPFLNAMRLSKLTGERLHGGSEVISLFCSQYDPPPSIKGKSAINWLFKWDLLVNTNKCSCLHDTKFNSCVHRRDAANTTRWLLFMLRSSFFKLSKAHLTPPYYAIERPVTWNMRRGFAKSSFPHFKGAIDLHPSDFFLHPPLPE